MHSVKEKWKPIKGYSFYEVSNLGRVRSLPRTVRKKSRWGSVVSVTLHGKILKQATSGYKNNYLIVQPCKNGKNKPMYVHRLVAQAFIPNPKMKEQVNHKDSNPKNNVVKNLEWVTAKEHDEHTMRSGRKPKGSNHKNSKLTEVKVQTIRRLIKRKWSDDRIAKRYSVSPATITDIKNKRTWAWL